MKATSKVSGDTAAGRVAEGADSPCRMSMRVGGRLLQWDRPLVMAIINSTPDSFYAGSRNATDPSLRGCIREALAAGADILDLGAYSTRPGAPEVSEEEEWRRLESALKSVRAVVADFGPSAFSPSGPILSIDTFRSGVARRAVEEYGAHIINDVSGGDMDPEMFATVAALQVPYILMHMRGTPADMQSLTDYSDVTADVISDLAFKADRLRDMGVADIIVDPGFGFAKTVEQNYRMLADLAEFKRMGMPVLAGLSRKSMIWRPLGISPSEALPGTIALNMAALERGADILRVHDVAAARQTVDVFTMLQKA